MLRRRGSAPPDVLRHQLSDFNSSTNSLPQMAATVIQPHKNAKNKRTKAERSGSPPTMFFAERRISEVQKAFEFEAAFTAKPLATAVPAPKPQRYRTKRRESEPCVLTREQGNSLPRTVHAVATSKRLLNLREYNIVLLGHGGVGKSGLYRLFLSV